ncbi:hypothetical protein AS156_01365 [Bradyrhizobium macuxiense]|uniref:Oligosaccharide repeat unit polymerase n=1 Tax=Bradyrhizobium macuxiense TaxID=1755647 RepID=A0A109JKK1_9BRAD|nr:hypothetical protein [Bradyrhizobium macuxiense]KWV50625.1 hypothetical protein AS156_01365 [Bradyrhizobium macuxiense]
MNFIFVAALIAGTAYFLFRNRTFDLFAVAFGGCAFYFLPLLIGSVPDWNAEEPLSNHIPLSPGAYWIGIGITVAIICAAAVFDSRSPQYKTTRSLPQPSLANWYLLVSFVALVGAARSGRLLELNKTVLLSQLGYWFALFETSAGLAWIDAFFFRRPVQLILATALLAVDLVLGFRMISVMVFIACTMLALHRQGRINLWRKLPFVGVAVVTMFVFMVTVNYFRGIALPRLGMVYTEIQTSPSAESNEKPSITAPQPKQYLHPPETVFTLLPGMLGRLEPFVTQAILSETTRQSLTCTPGRIAKSIALVVPFAGRFITPPTLFESEYKPTLFPHQWAGMAGNIWAEMFCEYGYGGVVMETAAVLLALLGFQLLIFRATAPSAIPALALCGVFLAFYVHRNDMLFELLLVRRPLIVFTAVWIIEYLRRQVFGAGKVAHQGTGAE